MEPWWVRHPAALEAEKVALAAWGQPWELDEAEYAAGRLVIKVQAPIAEGVHQLTALYPDSYPYFPPGVRLDGFRLPRHHNPEGFLCLLANDGSEWQPGIDTLAGLLQSQLLLLTAAANPVTDPEVVAQTEEHAGEPLSNFLPYISHSAILIPDEVPPTEVTWGRLELQGRMRADAGFSAVLSRVLSPTGLALVSFPLQLSSFQDRITGYWLRLPVRPLLQGPSADNWRRQFFELACDQCEEFKKRLDAARAGEVFVFGFIYPDEVSWRQSAQDWIFLSARVERPRKGARPPGVRYAFVRADPAGDAALAMRAPELAALRSKSVLLVGLGAIGSPVALQLAKSGIAHLQLIDADHLQVGNTVRWALGWGMAGWPKAEAIATYIAHEFPRTKPEPYTLRIGGRLNNQDGTPLSDYDFLRERISQADLVIDATANFLVNHLLTDIARREKKPYLWLSTTPGAAGGVVGRVVPGKTQGCWHCFQHRLADGSIAVPSDSGVADVQPGGCTHPTFVAAGIDSDEVAVLATRLAVATLTSGEAEGKDFQWDVAVGDLVDGDHRIAGRWSAHPLSNHPACQLCAAEKY
jgi:molybdopterin/thiamine biosynthesis adenylyltransferase/ubiquitin-protein ligase